MKITELLTKHTIKLQLDSQQKEAVIEELVTVLDTAGKLNDKEGYKAAVVNRENKALRELEKELRFLMRKQQV